MKKHTLKLRKSTLKRLTLNVRSGLKTAGIKGDTTIILDPPSAGNECQTFEQYCPSNYCAY